MNVTAASDILLVDGYNVLRSSGLYAVADDDAYNDFSHDPLNAAREALINDVAVFAHTRYKATVVFDGGGNPSSTGQRSEVAGVGVIFSAAGTCADATIEELARSAASSERNVLVVSSDATIQWTVLGPRVTRMSAMGFADEMRAIKKVAAYELEAVTVKNTLAERLDPKVREQLSNMVRKRT